MRRWTGSRRRFRARLLARSGPPVAHPPRPLDGSDWWFRCRFPGKPGRSSEFGGVATVADVWLNGDHLCHNENMFRGGRLPSICAPGTTSCSCGALHCRRCWPRRVSAPAGRPIWSNTRTFVGSERACWGDPGCAAPPAVGPWRPIRLVPFGDGTRPTCRFGPPVTATMDW